MSRDRLGRVLDLFCGMGGLGYGFSRMGFEVVGVDVDKKAGMTYTKNAIGEFTQMDLMHSNIHGRYGIIIGGPPCEPWSSLNLKKRRMHHSKYGCVAKFFRVLREQRPVLFVLENVPGVRNDPIFKRQLERMKEVGYDVDIRIVRYSDYGAATSRRRLFAIGIKEEFGNEAPEIFERIGRDRLTTVREAIGDLRNLEQDPKIDHIWPAVTTIHRYIRYYETGKYGWYVLDWDRPAPSFGNICKTYILHPDSFNGGKVRPISVREALRIVGFPDDYGFPEGVGITSKYEMIADTVSPVFSRKLAVAVKKTLFS